MAVRSVKYLEYKGIELENDRFRAVVLPSEGSNIISLYDKTKEAELLRTTSDAEEYKTRRMVYGTPVLIPPNRIEDATFTFNQQVYHLEMNRKKEENHIHGFVHDKEWTVKEMDSDQNRVVTALVSDDFPHIMDQFPHSFTLEMEIELTNEGLKQTLKVTNKGDSLMPFGLGYHTTFYFDNEASTLQMDVEKEWVLNDRNLPTGELKATDYKEPLAKGMHLQDVRFDTPFPMTQNTKALIRHESLGIELAYDAAEGFKHWVLFTADGRSNFVAIEPYSWITNAPNLKLPDEVTGMMSIEPNENKEFVATISVKHF
ncbi:aldose 1-epimerase [Peribacillus kribbensis]|uniref:aldose 1-epimerase n=1 Tax=Peribacillus kribbensis TaxID=356658 RepID=UPI0003FAA5AB|nr:aldose 1-epimerase [Peribacillus kribbensis]